MSRSQLYIRLSAAGGSSLLSVALNLCLVLWCLFKNVQNQVSILDNLFCNVMQKHCNVKEGIVVLTAWVCSGSSSLGHGHGRPNTWGWAGNSVQCTVRKCVWKTSINTLIIILLKCVMSVYHYIVIKSIITHICPITDWKSYFKRTHWQHTLIIS